MLLRTQQRSIQAPLHLPVCGIVPEQAAQGHDNDDDETKNGEHGHIRMRDNPPFRPDGAPC